jgi:aryl-alcohol dehydrogenase-like predicted oxidoreductase
MEFRQLGRCGLKVPALSLGTGTFGGVGEMFGKWGHTGADEAIRLIDICLEAGLNLFDTANIYSQGKAEEVLGEAVRGRRGDVLISTKATYPVGDGPNDKGSSRYHLIRQCEASLRRLATDYVDLYFMHGHDALTPVEETLRALDDLTRAGKIRYIGCSNFSGWQLMKSLAASERYGLSRYVSYQGYYSLIAREYEWELMPLALDQGLGTIVWSPLGYSRLTGKIRRGTVPREGRIYEGGAAEGPQVDTEYLYTVVDVLDEVANEVGKSVPQVAINWLLHQPSVASITIGARNESQLRENLGAVGWALSDEHMARLAAVSKQELPYPYWLAERFSKHNQGITRDSGYSKSNHV